MFNSDGYILLDFTGVDITKTNQYLKGIYQRVINSIDTNKLALVINAGNLTPQAAIIHKRLNYYVITTSLYIFTVNSNDIIIIEQAGQSQVDVAIVPTLTDGVKLADFTIGAVEGSIYAPEFQTEINDNVTANNTTWSSDKIDDELSIKANTASLASVATSGDYDDLIDKPSIPTKTSDLVNDSGYITSAQVPTIDDNAVASDKVWSSYKTSFELGNKANSTDVYTKTEVDTALSSKQNNLTVQAGTISSETGTTIARQTLLKFGNVVFLTCDLKVANVVRWSTFASLPSEFKPASNIYTVAINTGSTSGAQIAHVQISSGGNLAFGNSLPDSNVQYSITVAWIIN